MHIAGCQINENPVRIAIDMPGKRRDFCVNETRRLLGLATAALLALTIWFPARAGEEAGGEAEGVIESVNGSFVSRIANGVWNSWQVTVRNPAAQPLTTGVILRMSGMSTAYLRRVTIPAASRMQVRLEFLVNLPAEKFERLFKTNKSTENLPGGKKREIIRYSGTLEYTAALVDLKTNREFSVFKNQALLTYPDYQNLVIMNDDPPLREARFDEQQGGLPVVLGDDHLARPLVRDEARPLLPGPAELSEELRPVQQSFAWSERLPDHWSAYRSLQAIVIGNCQPFNPAQQAELERWLRAGGKLILFPGEGPEIYQKDAFWAGLLPVSIDGVRPALQEDFTRLQRGLGGVFRLPPGRAPRMARAYLRPEGELVAGTADSPLLARRRVGAGEVWFCALTSDGLAGGAATAGYFIPLLQPGSKAIPGLPERLQARAMGFLQTLTGLPVPPKKQIALLMLGYLAAATLLLFIMRRAGRGELGWPILVGLSILTCAGAFLMMRAGQGERQFSGGEAGVTLLSAGGAGLNQTWTGAYPFADLGGTLEWQTGGMAVSPLASVPGGSGAVVQDYLPSLPQTRLTPGQFWGAAGAGNLTLGQGVELRCRFGAEGLAGKVVNRTGGKLEHGLIHINRRIVWLGDLAPDESKDLRAGRIYTLEEFVKQDFGSGWSDRRNLLLLTMFPAKIGADANFQPVFFAFAGLRPGQFSLKTNIGQSVQDTGARSLQLVAALLEIARPEGKVLIPAGMCGLNFASAAQSNLYYGYPPLPVNEKTAMPRPGAYPIPRPGPGKPGIPGKPAASSQTGARPAGTPMAAKVEAEEKAPAFDPALECVTPQWQSGTMPGRFAVRFHLPSGLNGLTLTGGELTFRGEMQGVGAEFYLHPVEDNGKDAAKKDEPILLGRLQPGKDEFLCKIPAQAFARAAATHGIQAMEFEVRMRNAPGQLAPGGMKWQIKDFDLRLEGQGGK